MLFIVKVKRKVNYSQTLIVLTIRDAGFKPVNMGTL